MVHAIRVERTGGPEVMEWAETTVAAPGPGEVRLRHTAVGVNFVDVYYRSGLYPPPGGLPYTPGAEGAGVVVAVGPGVTGLAAGDRVVYQGWAGGYAEERLMPADKLVKLPDDIDDKVAAAAFLKGLTVQCLIRRTFKVEKGTVILWHAAAGGVGSLASQWASRIGATVIGTVGSDDKAELAKSYGCAHVINYKTEDFVARVKEITGGEGVDVAYDSVGKDTFPGSLDCLKPMGMWVAFGQSSGLPPPFTTSMLQQKGSLFATRPTILHYLAKRADLEASAAELFQAIREGVVTVPINQTYALKDAAEAHRALEERRTSGQTVLLP
ncbi:MAG TPA: quinone oxidoreductase [Bauldia sp.]|nr:quinone oxidoreductase [Bauldia sp.]